MRRPSSRNRSRSGSGLPPETPPSWPRPRSGEPTESKPGQESQNSPVRSGLSPAGHTNPTQFGRCAKLLLTFSRKPGEGIMVVHACLRSAVHRHLYDGGGYGKSTTMPRLSLNLTELRPFGGEVRDEEGEGHPGQPPAPAGVSPLAAASGPHVSGSRSAPTRKSAYSCL
jgi:hypothetical protein